MYSKLKDCYRLSLNTEFINELYNEHKSITAEDLCLCKQYLDKKNSKAFYSVVLADYDDISDETLQSEYRDYSDYDFIVINNCLCYPDACDYKLELS